MANSKTDQEPAKDIGKDVGKKVVTEGLATGLDSIAPGVGTLAKPMIEKGVDKTADEMDKDKKDPKPTETNTEATPDKGKEKEEFLKDKGTYEANMMDIVNKGAKDAKEMGVEDSLKLGGFKLAGGLSKGLSAIKSAMSSGPDTKQVTEISKDATGGLPMPGAGGQSVAPSLDLDAVTNPMHSPKM